jgi:hypothetical protein
MGLTQQYCCLVRVDLHNGLLRPGIHWYDWQELVDQFGTTPHRRALLSGLKAALTELARAGCRAVYLDGSFVTDKLVPNDYDLCWEMDYVDLACLDPIIKDTRPPRNAQKVKYMGDLLPNVVELSGGLPFLEFFQIDKNTGAKKGIVALDPRKVGP